MLYGKKVITQLKNLELEMERTQYRRKEWKCDHCGKHGHTVERCYILKREKLEIEREKNRLLQYKQRQEDEKAFKQNVFENMVAQIKEPPSVEKVIEMITLLDTMYSRTHDMIDPLVRKWIRMQVTHYNAMAKSCIEKINMSHKLKQIRFSAVFMNLLASEVAVLWVSSIEPWDHSFSYPNIMWIVEKRIFYKGIEYEDTHHLYEWCLQHGIKRIGFPKAEIFGKFLQCVTESKVIFDMREFILKKSNPEEAGPGWIYDPRPEDMNLQI